MSWTCLFEPELHLGEDVLVPDLGGWRRDRMPVPPGSSAFTVSPDRVCEVLSPGTERLDRTRRLPAYARAGVLHACLANPRTRTLEMLRLEAAHWLLVSTRAGDEIVRAESFEAAALDLLALRGQTRPTDAG